MQPFPQWVLQYQPSQLPDQLGVPPHGKIGFDARLQSSEPLLLEPGRFRRRERLVAELRQRRPTPQAQRRTQAARRALRVRADRAGAFAGQPFEAIQVDLLGLKLQ